MLHVLFRVQGVGFRVLFQTFRFQGSVQSAASTR